MGDIFSEFDRVVDSFLQPTYARTVNFQPSCDVNETEGHYLISFDMPGVKKDDIKIEVKDNQLLVSGERHRLSEGNEASDKFERTFSLPNSVNTEKIEASYENGVLNVALPKAEAAKARTIEIQSGQTGFWSHLIGSRKEAKDLKVS
jgi:HSP20 family protein